jgi:DNA-binding CsgD family transcriptional regulator
VDFAELADRLAAASDEHTRTMDAARTRSGQDLSALLDALSRLRHDDLGADVVDVLDCAARELCQSAVFERVMVSRVDGSTWSPLQLYVLGGDGRVVVDVDAIGGGVDDFEIALLSPLVEAEVVRRRLPALVLDAAHEPRVHAPLLERTGTKEYVVAPVVANGVLVGLLHADRASDGRPLTELDRDLLRMFADGVGLVLERGHLAERERRQRRAVVEACQLARDFLEEFDLSASGSPLTSSEALSVTASSTRPDRESRLAHHREGSREGSRLSKLTAREREVLALLASGATNSQLADQLTVAESTVKSHVKHILHKLGAGNRAAAIACYLREVRDDERRPR